MTQLVQEIIATKRDGLTLTDAQIAQFIGGVADGTLPDYQAAAMLMAIYLKGLEPAELAKWTDSMLHSGHVFDRGIYGRPAVDKHSTGGVGDKISLPLGAAVAACGLAVPMISGRGLGHTGGTLDKLEAIPGFRIDLSGERFVEVVREIGICMIGQTENIVPADRTLYALRDATATVASVPLISSSIMSKKLAEGIDALVLDLKVGPAAFMADASQGHALAEAIQSIGASAGTPVTVVMTRMDNPIGVMVGNANEIAETIEVLHGGGPADTRDLTVVLGAEMLLAGGIASDPADAAARVAGALDDGSAADVFARMVAAQGGDPDVVTAPDRVLPRAEQVVEITADRTGAISRIDGFQVGLALVELGGGRRVKSDTVDPSVGIEMLARPGDQVKSGQVLAVVRHNERGVEGAQNRLVRAFEISDEVEPQPETRVLEVMRP